MRGKAGSQSELERTRLIAADMFDQGLTTAQIAAALEVDTQAVRRRRRTYEAEGRDGLRAGGKSGRPPLPDAARRERLAGLLGQGPAACGPGRYLWTTRRVADLIARDFGVTYHHDHLGVLLGALGFTHRKPARLARERDEARIEAWRRDEWPAG